MIEAIEGPLNTAALPHATRCRSRKVRRCVEHFLALVGTCFIIYSLCFEFTVMTSGSMAPTLRGNSYEDGDRILLEKVTSWLRQPSRWEIYFSITQRESPSQSES